MTKKNNIEQEKVIVIHPTLKHQNSENILSLRSAENRLEEAVGLAQAINLKIVLAQVIILSKITPSSFVGKGKLEEIKSFIESENIKLLIIDEKISPTQQRNLENFLACKVIDRTALILEIFGARAKTREGKLQVELAALEYQKSRLVRSWTHLERQRGGGGFLGGPGEKQIESDRRMLGDKILVIKQQLSTIVKTRQLHRKSRQKVPYKIVSLVGYTNAGKSTLFNKITSENVFAKDLLFATLDPTMRLVKLPSGNKIILSDTVGFISNLPTELIAAFRATLEEVIYADIIIHVRDIAHEDSKAQKQDVDDVLKKLSSGQENLSPIIEVLNKIDLLDEENLADIYPSVNVIGLSALTGKNIDQLLLSIDKLLNIDNQILDLTIDPSNGQLLAWLYEHGQIISRQDGDESVKLNISISIKNHGALQKLVKENAWVI